MKVIVASKNPVKISSTQAGFEKIFIDKSFGFEGVDVPSGVSDQPMTDTETLQGATNRAMNARTSHPDADFWVGIEGGLDQTPKGLLAFAWVVIFSSHQSGQSRTSTFHLPPKVAELIDQGIELGLANDQVFSEHNSKQKGGAVGSLTKGVLGRSEYYEQPVMLALVPFINPEMYPNSAEKA
ncbi:MAG: inosine/xanthosine triphosphatase [Marinoscillum sp.]|jgi:inosine/xanthosine triphosphatase